MGEVKITIGHEEKHRNGIRLFCRTLVHTVYVCINLGVTMYGGYVGLTMSKEALEIPLIREMQKFVLCFFTNWNYVMDFGINLQSLNCVDVTIFGVIFAQIMAKNSVGKLLLNTLFHGASLFLYGLVSKYGFGLLFNLTEENLNIPQFFLLRNYHYAYLTHWSYMFQTVFLSLSLLYDVMEWLDKHQSELGKKLMYYRDVLFCGVVVPFTLFISTMFWAVYFIDRELVFPTVYDKVVPWWFNHCVHTNITVMILVETLLQARRNPTNYKLELSLIGGIGVFYAIVYYSIFFITGRWLYAVFGVMTWWQVCIYQLGIWGSTFIFYYLQFPINRIFHREEKVDEKGEKNMGFDPDNEYSLKLQGKKEQIENSHL